MRPYRAVLGAMNGPEDAIHAKPPARISHVSGAAKYAALEISTNNRQAVSLRWCCLFSYAIRPEGTCCARASCDPTEMYKSAIKIWLHGTVRMNYD
jgi:hypothetical protein